MKLQILAQIDRNDEGNPYTGLLYDSLHPFDTEIEQFSRKGLLRRRDIVHVHWPEQVINWNARRTDAFFQVIRALVMLRIARLRGAKLVWTAHDLGPHEGHDEPLVRYYFQEFLRQVDLVISLSWDGHRRVIERFPQLGKVPAVVIPHGHYRDVYTDGDGGLADELKRTAPLGGSTLLVLGQIRPYKGIPDLVAAYRTSMANSRLIIAGDVRGSDTLRDEIVAASKGDPRIVLRLRSVTAQELVSLHEASDAIVLPYHAESALHSGALFTALSLGRPVVARDSGTVHEIQAHVGDSWLETFNGGAGASLDAAFEMLRRQRGAAPDMRAYDWTEIGRATYRAYRKLSRP